MKGVEKRGKKVFFWVIGVLLVMFLLALSWKLGYSTRLSPEEGAYNKYSGQEDLPGLSSSGGKLPLETTDANSLVNVVPGVDTFQPAIMVKEGLCLCNNFVMEVKLGCAYDNPDGTHERKFYGPCEVNKTKMCLLDDIGKASVASATAMSVNSKTRCIKTEECKVPESVKTAVIDECMNNNPININPEDEALCTALGGHVVHASEPLTTTEIKCSTDTGITA